MYIYVILRKYYLLLRKINNFYTIKKKHFEKTESKMFLNNITISIIIIIRI